MQTSGVAHSLPWIAPVMMTVGLPRSSSHEAFSVIRMAVIGRGGVPSVPLVAPMERTTAKPEELSARSPR